MSAMDVIDSSTSVEQEGKENWKPVPNFVKISSVNGQRSPLPAKKSLTKIEEPPQAQITFNCKQEKTEHSSSGNLPEVPHK
jgi:hypothetical protein